MPSESGAQQRYMAAAYARKKAGQARATDPKMTTGQLHDFMYKRPGAPERAKKAYGKGPVSEAT
jgi:hypothetical protein